MRQVYEEGLRIYDCGEEAYEVLYGVMQKCPVRMHTEAFTSQISSNVEQKNSHLFTTEAATCISLFSQESEQNQNGVWE